MLSLIIKMVVSSGKRTVEFEGRVEGRSLMKAEKKSGTKDGALSDPRRWKAWEKSRSQEHW